MNQEPEKPEILDYATPPKKSPGESSTRLLGFRLIWVATLSLSLLTVLSARNFDSYQWPAFLFIALTLSGFGIYANRKLFQKSRAVFLLKTLLWLFPLFLNLLAVRGGYEFNRRIKHRPSRLLIIDINGMIKEELHQEEYLDPSQRRPMIDLIDDVLKKSPKDQWGNPYRSTYPQTSRINPFGVYSAGPDGVYGNADDIMHSL